MIIGSLHKYTKEFRYNWKLASPVITGMLGHTLVSFVDNVMVGQMGTAELAAVSLGNSFLFIAMSLGIGFSTAITPLVAESDSEGNFASGQSVLKHGVFLCTLLSVVLFGLILLGKPLMSLMQQPEEVVALALPYLDLVAISLIPLIIFQAFKQFSDGMSKTVFPMYATIIANIINVLLNYVLIFGKFGFPQMGIVGAAIGTLISRGAMLVILIVLLKRNKKTAPFLAGLNFRNIQKRMSKKLLNLGFPSALQMFFEVALFTAAIWLSGVLGKNMQAANQIALNLASMTFMFAMGLGVTAMIRVGNQKGLRNFTELRRVAQSIFLLGLLFAIGFAVIFMLFRFSLPNLYVNVNDLSQIQDTREVVASAASLLLLAAIFQISDSVQVMVLGALRGMQDVKIPSLITFISYWVIGFPVCYFLGKPNMFGGVGIWIGLLFGLTTASVLMYLRFQYLTKKWINNERID
ncbi:MAG: MATE family efflux transporter [Bacteroidetes bacterium]|nr:MATE family efflux transporter [Bacteroidota bacterium]MDA0879817.1 MATE family efflux transporter [Bacteroidota bacterium]MDA1115805.1 MATE family efflux transporter [Bacteroidota bacterium]